MILTTVAFDDPAVAIRGALHLKPTPQGLLPRRLPDWTEPQMPDQAMALVVNMPSGVRIALRGAFGRIELDALVTGLRLVGLPPRPPTFDLFVDGERVRRVTCGDGPTLVVDGSSNPPSISLDPGGPSTVTFADLAEGTHEFEIWLPQAATVALRGLRIDGVTHPLEASGRRRWAHYGSSISHGMEAVGPSETWPAVAARAAGVDLVNLGFAGQCHVDGMVARALRDADVDLISLKLGINLLNADSMRERAFIPAVHHFLDVIREKKPTTPILIVSPILCPAVEDHPGPTIGGGPAIRVVERSGELAVGALTARRIRKLLSTIVERRREAGDANLSYMDGLALFDETDLGNLPDGLHPDAEGLKRMGQRFADYAFAPGGAFAA